MGNVEKYVNHYVVLPSRSYNEMLPHIIRGIFGPLFSVFCCFVSNDITKTINIIWNYNVTEATVIIFVAEKQK